MKKAAEFLVKRRVALFIFVLALAALCAVFASTLKVNTDMTQYLPETSNMKQGIARMETEFPASEDAASIRVMFDDLSAAQIEAVRGQLESLPYVSRVDYVADSGDYNQGNHTLFVVNTGYDYDSAEEAAIERALEERFGGYTMAYQNNDVQSSKVTPLLLGSALTIALVILVLMSQSWVEPLLFMATIGVAVLLNLGTNIVFPYTSDLTASVAPIIQLVLSMDYSIILMNRYRLEKQHCDSRTEAMKVTLRNSFASIASSALTTVVGLLALVFLSFRLGPELGIVLAKGALISMLCVFTVLPALILWCDRAIETTKKRTPRIPMGGLARFSHQARTVMPLLFVALFVAFYFIQGNTGITFTEGIADPLAKVFPKKNTLVLLYDKREEDGAARIVAELETDAHIEGVTSYSGTLGKPLNAADMAEALKALDGDARIDKGLIDLVYFLKNDGAMPRMTAQDFLSFVREDVRADPLLSEALDPALAEQLDGLEPYSDRETLTRPMSAAELADLFGLDSGDVQKLCLYYFAENGGVDYGTMTLPAFAAFALRTAENGADAAAAADVSALAGLRTLQTFSDAAAMTRCRSYASAAAVLGLEAETMKLVYVCYQAQSAAYTPPQMTLAQFAAFAQSDVAGNPLFSARLPEDAAARLQTLAALSDKNALTSPLPPAALAQMLGLEEAAVQGIFQLAGNSSGAMSVADTVSFILSSDAARQSLDAETLAQLGALQQLISLVLSDAALTSDALAAAVGLDAETAKLLFTYHDAQNGAFERQYYLSVQAIVDFLLQREDLFGAALGDKWGELCAARKLIDAAVGGGAYPPAELAALTGLAPAQVEQLYLLHRSEAGDTDDWKLSPQQFVTFAADTVLPDPDFAGYFDAETAGDLRRGRTLIDAVVSGKVYTDDTLYALLQTLTDDISRDEVTLLYLYYGGVRSARSDWEMTVPQLIEYLNDELGNDERLAGVLDAERKSALAESRSALDDALAQMTGARYARAVFTSDYAEESPETSAYLARLDALRNEYLTGDSYLIGTSAMVYEMENSFDGEFLSITLITAVAIFLVVLLAFRNLVVPALLTLLVQCGVYITVSLVGLRGGTMYYLALLIVQSILMGATIDYGIVFSNAYRESRRTLERADALRAAYENSIHTIMTSGSILVLVTGILGVFSAAKVTAQVCLTLSIGSLVAVLLILLVLPGILDFCDRFVVKKSVRQSGR